MSVGVQATNAEVTFKDLSKTFGPVMTVNKLNLRVSQGEFLVLLGPSGCGKATSLRMLAGLERISSGTIRIGEAVVNELPPRSRNVAMVFQAMRCSRTCQSSTTSPIRSVSAAPKGSIAPRVHDMARLLQIEGLLERRQKQLYGVRWPAAARCARSSNCRHPAVFLMDEPLSNLDAQLRVHTRSELKRLQSELGVTTIYVTHDPAEAMTLADRVAIMREGVLQQVGPPREIYDRPANTFVAGFLGSPGMNYLLGALTSESGKLWGTSTGNRVGLPSEWGRAVSSASSAGKVYLGVRPEAVSIRGTPDDSAFPAEVYVSEALGNETLARIQLNGQELVARAEASFEPELGSRVWVKPNMARAHLFDGNSKARLV